MCLYPKIIINKKYLANKKNKGIVPKCEDMRTKYVPVGCGKCWECRKQKARQWQIRLYEEFKADNDAHFITLTFSPENYIKIKTKYNCKSENEVATIAIRLTLERVRKEKKKSIKHWFITEIGHDNTKRLHLHGITWNKEYTECLQKKWEFGITFIGNYMSEKAISYITKYMTKPDTENKNYIGKVLCSPGIGKNYINSINAKNNKFNNENTNESYRLKDGTKLNLPIYYRNKLYTENEREKLWINKLNEGIKYVCGEKVNINNEIEYFKLLEWHRRDKAKAMGYDYEKWENEHYRETQLKLKNYINSNGNKKQIEKLKKEGKNDLDFINYKYLPEKDNIPF